MKFLLPYAQLVRLPNTFTVIADILLGAMATGFLSARARWFLNFLPEWLRKSSSPDVPMPGLGYELKQWFMLACLVFASIFLYWSGMIWNDYFDLDQDRKERPGRPLASGRVTLRTAVYLAFGLMAGGLVLAFAADCVTGRWIALPLAVLLVGAIFLYDGMLKATVAGPIAMGLCRSLNILLGLSIAGEWPAFAGWLIALIIGIYIGGVTWFARTEARDSSKSMLIGAAIAMFISLVLSLAVPAFVVETPGDAEPSRLFPYLLAGFGCYLGVAVIAAIRRPEPSRVQTVIVRAIMGLVVLDALLASAFVGSLGLLLVVLLVPGLVLGRWLYTT